MLRSYRLTRARELPPVKVKYASPKLRGSIMHPILALVAVIAFTAAQAHAAPCPDWTTDRPGSDFWRVATVADIAGCIEAGAKVEARDKYGMTPLHMAALQNKNPAVVVALIEAGTKVNARGPGGFTPLHRAAMGNENPAVATALVEAGARVEARTIFGETPLHLAAGNNENPAVIAALIEAGADTEAREPLFGMTPLHRAAMGNENPAVATALLEAGANPRAKANNGKMPIDYAMDNEALKGSKVYWRLNDARFGD